MDIRKSLERKPVVRAFGKLCLGDTYVSKETIVTAETNLLFEAQDIRLTWRFYMEVFINEIPDSKEGGWFSGKHHIPFLTLD